MRFVQDRSAILKATAVAGFVAILWSTVLPGFHFLGKESSILPPNWALIQALFAAIGIIAMLRNRPEPAALLMLLSIGNVLAFSLVAVALMAGSNSFGMVSPLGWISSYVGVLLLILAQPLRIILHR